MMAVFQMLLGRMRSETLVNVGFTGKELDVFHSTVVVQGYPSVFPDIDFGPRVDFPVVKGFKRFDAINNALPDPRWILNRSRFVRVGGREIFMFKGIINRGG